MVDNEVEMYGERRVVICLVTGTRVVQEAWWCGVKDQRCCRQCDEEKDGTGCSRSGHKEIRGDKRLVRFLIRQNTAWCWICGE